MASTAISPPPPVTRLQSAMADPAVTAPEVTDAVFSMSVLAHELRTPLSAFQATIELLNEITPPTNDEMNLLLDRLGRSSRWMETLITNMLVLSQIERDHEPLVRHPLDLLRVVETMVELVQPILDRRRQYCRLSVAASHTGVVADEFLIGQVLMNLLTNASIYGPVDEPIDIMVRELAGRVEVRVTDRGPGVPPAERARIFERYVRGSTSRHNGQGLGLGLYLVRTIVERYSGTIGVENAPGQGASFWIRLPRHEEHRV